MIFVKRSLFKFITQNQWFRIWRLCLKIYLFKRIFYIGFWNVFQSLSYCYCSKFLFFTDQYIILKKYIISFNIVSHSHRLESMEDVQVRKQLLSTSTYKSLMFKVFDRFPGQMIFNICDVFYFHNMNNVQLANCVYKPRTWYL